MKRRCLSLSGYVALACLCACTPNSRQNADADAVRMVELKNPILPGYFADPSLVQYDGKFYMYATADPWGTDFLSCWVSDDFQNWTFHTLNWPTKAACSTRRSEANKVWAPSVVQKGDTFYMYVSVGSEVWCGKAKHPLGPWENMLDDKPLIVGDETKYYHVIDAEVFTDDDGKNYLYWGSGWNWTNGHCYAAELGEDMKSFVGEPVEVTPDHYFEAPFMLKRDGKYYLTYSEGKTIDETYEVRYAVGDTPFGPFVEADNSPILTFNDSLQVYGPGHHAAFTYGGEQYILYHRHRLPFVTGTAYRQTCLGKLVFNGDKVGLQTIVPTHVQAFPDLSSTTQKKSFLPKSASATSTTTPDFTPSKALDYDYTTRWEAADDDKDPKLEFIFKELITPQTIELRPEYPWKKYYFKVITSIDGECWNTLADYSSEGVSGSPVELKARKSFRYVRIFFAPHPDAARPSLWEVAFY